MPKDVTNPVSKNEAADCIAQLAKRELQAALALKGQAVIALSGGSTPIIYLPAVFSLDLDWAKIGLVLADERWVPPDHADSNERLIDSLRQDSPAQSATLISLWSQGSNPDQAAQSGRKKAQDDHMEIDLTFLGMGADGHIASLFPNDPALDSDEPYWIAVDAPSLPNVPVARLSLSPKTLIDSRNLVLVFSGQEKYAVWRSAWRGTQTASESPVSTLKEHPRLSVFCISE